MQMVAPAGPVYQAGTLSGNPLAMAAGIATLKLLAEPGQYEDLERKSARLAEGIGAAARGRGRACLPDAGGQHVLHLFHLRAVRVLIPSARRLIPRPLPDFFQAMLGVGVLPGAIAVRGRFHVPGPFGRRHRCDD